MPVHLLTLLAASALLWSRTLVKNRTKFTPTPKKASVARHWFAAAEWSGNKTTRLVAYILLQAIISYVIRSWRFFFFYLFWLWIPSKMLAAVHPPVLFQIREGFLLAISCSSSVLILFTATIFSLEMTPLSPVTCFYLFIKKKTNNIVIIINSAAHNWPIPKSEI